MGWEVICCETPITSPSDRLPKGEGMGNIMKIKELRDMSTEHLALVLKDARDKLFRLRLQARMERLDSPSELKKNKQIIAQVLTLQKERELAARKKEGKV